MRRKTGKSHSSLSTSAPTCLWPMERAQCVGVIADGSRRGRQALAVLEESGDGTRDRVREWRESGDAFFVSVHDARTEDPLEAMVRDVDALYRELLPRVVYGAVRRNEVLYLTLAVERGLARRLERHIARLCAYYEAIRDNRETQGEELPLLEQVALTDARDVERLDSFTEAVSDYWRACTENEELDWLVESMIGEPQEDGTLQVAMPLPDGEYAVLEIDPGRWRWREDDPEAEDQLPRGRLH